jgi:deglycase
MTKIANAKIAILATDGYERSELRSPHAALRDKGASVEIVSVKAGHIKSWDQKDWGDSIAVDRQVGEVRVEDYDALVIPGGQINPDLLRVVPEAVAFVRNFVDSGKPVGAICHGPWLLVEADALRGRDATSYPSIRTDLVNAGANWQDREVVVDQGIVTSRKPDDLPAFIGKLVEEIEEGRHQRRPAA